jgi:hypothetical protein
VPGVASPADEAKIKRLRGQIAFDRRHLDEGARLFAEAAKVFERFDASAARQTLGEALCLAIWTGDLHGTFGIQFAAAAVASVPSPTEPVRPVDRVIEAFASRFTDGREISAPLFTRAAQEFLNPDAGSDQAGQ